MAGRPGPGAVHGGEPVAAREEARDDTLNGIEVVYMDTDKLISEGDEWEDRYERIIQEGQVIPEEELE